MRPWRRWCPRTKGPEYLLRNDIRCNYIHSDVDTLERVKIMDELRQGVYDELSDRS